jgi:hypothetical protein
VVRYSADFSEGVAGLRGAEAGLAGAAERLGASRSGVLRASEGKAQE